MRRKDSLRCRTACASRKGSPPILKTEEIYVATFDFGPHTNTLLRFTKYGQLVAQRDFGGTPLLELQFHRWDDKVYICNFGTSKIQRIAANFTDTTEIEDVA